MSGGRAEIVSLPSTVVRVTADEGHGFGETCPLGRAYLPAHGAGARAGLAELAPALLGLDPREVAIVSDRMDARCRSSLREGRADIAVLDLLGKAAGSPCASCSAAAASVVPLYVAIPLGSPEEMAARVGAPSRGRPPFPAESWRRPRRRRRRGRRRVLGDRRRGPVIADANGGWRLQDAVPRRRLLEGLDRVYFEQPCPTLEECLYVRRRTPPADGARRGDHRRGPASCAPSTPRDGRDQPEALEARRPDARPSAPRARRDARRHPDDRGHLGRRPRHGRGQPLRCERPTRPLFTVSFMNDWMNEHIAGYEPRST